MGAFDRYMAARMMRDNPSLMAEFLADKRAERVAQQTPYVFGQPAQYEQQVNMQPMQAGLNSDMSSPPVSLMVDQVQTQAPTGLFDDTADPRTQMLEFNRRAGMSGAPEYQDMMMQNMQARNNAVIGPAGNNLGFGAARRMIQDATGDQFWVGNVTNKQTGQMDTVYSPIGHDKLQPEGQVELIDDLGLTAEEKIDWKARESRIMAEQDKDTSFYLEYLNNAKIAEDNLYETDYTMQKVMELYDVTDYGTTGLSKWISGIPLTGALDWGELKSTVQSRLALNKMMLLKAASSTGSTGFGALSERELKILTDHLGSLEQAQTPAQIKKTLGEIFTYLNRSKKRLSEAAEDDRQKYLRLHSRFKGAGAALPEGVQRREDARQPAPAAAPAAGGRAGVTKSGIQYTVGD